MLMFGWFTNQMQSAAKLFTRTTNYWISKYVESMVEAKHIVFFFTQLNAGGFSNQIFAKEFWEEKERKGYVARVQFVVENALRSTGNSQPYLIGIHSIHSTTAVHSAQF